MFQIKKTPTYRNRPVAAAHFESSESLFVQTLAAPVAVRRGGGDIFVLKARLLISGDRETSKFQMAVRSDGYDDNERTKRMCVIAESLRENRFTARVVYRIFYFSFPVRVRQPRES